MATLNIARNALAEAAEFFESCGSEGNEGTAMLAGDPRKGLIDRCFVPDQVAHRSTYGVAVEVTMKGKLELASALASGERWMARIHSHPNEAFHSKTDDENPVLTATGAFSIVVPFFGLGLRHGLSACAVFLRHDGRWQEIEPARLGDFLVEVD